MYETVLDDERVLAGVDDAPRLLERLVAQRQHRNPGEITITHLCPTCGSTAHGAPAVDLSVFVSRSRSGRMHAAALSGVARVGVDIESIERLARAPVDAVLLHPSETSAVSGLAGLARARQLTRLWTAKEAILKLVGVGLMIDPGQLRLEYHDNRFELIGWPGELDLASAPTLHSFNVSQDIVGTVAIATS